MDSRFWATQEALIHPNANLRVVAASGDRRLRYLSWRYGY
jgi:nitronate monooxygenase